MINHQVDILDNDQNIVRPFVLRIVDHIKYITNIPKDAELIYPGLGESNQQYVASTGRPKAALAADSAIVIQAMASFEEAMWSGQATHRAQHQPIFEDPSTGLMVRPAYQDLVIDIKVEYVTHSYNEAERWRKGVSRGAAQFGNTYMHESSYFYILPRWMWGIIKHVHDLRETHGGYGDSLTDFINKHISPQATPMSTQSGNAREIGIRETQGGIQGIFDFTMEPEPVDRNVPDGNHKVQFGYKVAMSIPTHLSITHPLVIHNSVVQEKFIPKSMLEYGNVAQRASQTTSALKLFECDSALRQHLPEIPLYRSPAFDVWKPDDGWKHYRMYGSFLVGYTADDQEVILDLNKLGNYQLSDSTKTWLKDEAHKDVNLAYTQPFFIGLFENEQLMSPDAIRVDPDLVVRLTRPLNMRKRYRIGIFILDKISKLNPKGMIKMADHPTFACEFLRLINATTGELNMFRPYVDLTPLKSCAVVAGITELEAYQGLIYINTHMTGIIETHRQPI